MYGFITLFSAINWSSLVSHICLSLGLNISIKLKWRNILVGRNFYPISWHFGLRLGLLRFVCTVKADPGQHRKHRKFWRSTWWCWGSIVVLYYCKNKINFEQELQTKNFWPSEMRLTLSFSFNPLTLNRKWVWHPWHPYVGAHHY